MLAGWSCVRRVIIILLLLWEWNRLGLCRWWYILCLQDQLWGRQQIVMVGGQRLVDGLVVLMRGVHEVINEVTSDEGSSIDRVGVCRRLLEILLMDIGMPGWWDLSSLKLHSVDKLSTPIVPSVYPLSYTRLIKLRSLLDPRSFLIIGTAVKHGPASWWMRYGTATLCSQFGLWLIQK